MECKTHVNFQNSVKFVSSVDDCELEDSKQSHYDVHRLTQLFLQKDFTSLEIRIKEVKSHISRLCTVSTLSKNEFVIQLSFVDETEIS